MIELIGFWANVTWLTVLLAAAPAVILLSILTYMIALITEDEKIATAFQEKLVKEHRTDDWVIFFNKFKAPAFLSYMTAILSFVAWIIVPMWLHKNEFHDISYSSELVLGVSQISERLAPFAGWVAIAIAAFIAFVFIGRKAYKLYVKVERALKDIKT